MAAKIGELESQVAALEQQIQQLEETDPPEPSQVHNEKVLPSEVYTIEDARALRSEISTIEDAVAFLDFKFPELWMSAHLTDGESDYWWLDSGEQIVMRSLYEAAGRSCVVNAVTYLLCDDMEISSVIGFRRDDSGGMPMLAINCIKTQDGYQFVDPVLGMQGDGMSRYGALLPEAAVSSMEEYVDLVCSDPEIKLTLDSLYVFENGERFEFYEDSDGYVTLRSPEAEPLYFNGKRYISHEEYAQMKYANVKPENIDSYQLSKMLGGTTLTAEEAYALVDAEPEAVKEQVRTAADLLMYMLAARVGDNGGCYCDNWGGYTWHTNYTAKKVMETRLGNCGSCANLANYLLEGDYEEIGFILHAYYPGNGGGHVYNYIKYQGEYYIVDYSWYIFNNYEPANDFRVMKLKTLAEYGKRIGELYGGVSMAIAHTSTGRHLPNIFGEEFGDNHYYVPQGAEYTVLYQSGDGYLIGEMPFDKKHYDWDDFWE
ncbi:MAG: hypothetical protein ACI3V5_04155 [Faecousia sp.]